MTNSYPILTRFAGLVVLPLAIAGGAFWYSMRSSLPASTTELKVAGRGPVQIVRDEHGVPTVSAARDEDVYFAMGYVHAQDRMWQLEFQRRVARGRMSEVVGKDAIFQDAWMRTLGIHRSARAAWDHLSEPSKRSLTAYADGVNAWLSEKHTLPIEFRLLNVRPEPWSPIDSLAWSKIFALNLAGNLDRETAKYVAQQILSPEQAEFFFSNGKEVPRRLADTRKPDRAQVAGMASLGSMQRSLERELMIGGAYVGSNAWVVSGALTGNGSTILANDPHLGLQMPSVWYPVIQQGNRLQASGMTLVGLPVIIFGQNRHIAWGGTNLMADVQDLCFERLDFQGKRYLADETWLPIEITVEHIPVASEFPAALHKAIDPVRMEVRRTRNGPMISDVSGNINQPVALRWTALADDDRSYDTFYQLSYAEDWPAFRESFRGYVAPALNMLYADKGGDIGRLVVGRIPSRKTGDGSLPVPGWDREYAWNGAIPFEEMPGLFNPKQGYIVSANDKPVDEAYLHFISNDWAPPERAARIDGLLRETLARSGRLSLDDNKPIQADVVSLSARKLLPVLTAMKAKDARQRRALDRLRAWNGAMDKDSVAASIFSGWTRYLGGELFATAITEDLSRIGQTAYLTEVLNDAPPDVIRRALTDPKETWCFRNSQARTRRCEDMLSSTLDTTLDELEKLAGSNPDSWKWGAIHRTAYKHQPFGQVKALSSLFGRKVASGGGNDTVAVSGFVFRESEGYVGTFGAGFRQIIQLGPGHESHLYMNSTGQSANVFSTHYSDMIGAFEKGEYYSLKPAHSAKKSDR